MNLISLLGLAALLGIAWILSVHRTEVRFRTVLWGLGLQFLLAIIILREDYWSFVGMAVLGGLLVTYMLHRGLNWPLTAILVAASFGVGYVFYDLVPELVPALLGLTVVLLVANARLRLAPSAQRFLGSLFVVLGVAYLTSRGLYGQVIFQGLSTQVGSFLSLSDYGARFLFGGDNFDAPASGVWPGFGAQFAFKVLPTIIFFGAFMSVLYYLGLIQKVIVAIARFMRWTMRTSGAETFSCSANIFVGQIEAALLIKPFLDRMTKSELLTIMVGGFATIAGGVLAGYIAMGVPAGHLIAASVMSAPAALVIGKIIFPETEESETAGEIEMPEIQSGDNVIEAATNGILDGLKLAANVGAMLIGFIALIAVLDVVLNWLDGLIDGAWLGGEYIAYKAVGMSPAVGEYAGWFPGSLQTLFGTALRPLAFLMGVPWHDATLVGNLLGVKLSLNEFVAYGTLGSYIQNGDLGERAVIISTYALCGFANFSSIGMQIGGISAVAPGRKSDLARGHRPPRDRRSRRSAGDGAGRGAGPRARSGRDDPRLPRTPPAAP
jgi:CNT family concentrative nucleoside transporter